MIPPRATPTWRHRLLDLVFPRSCLACGLPPDRSPLDHLCATCTGRLEPLRGPRCPRCGSPAGSPILPSAGDATGAPPSPASPAALARAAAAGRLQAPACADCAHLPARLPWSEGRALFRHRGPSRTFLLAFKYRHASFLKDDLRRLLHLFPDLPSWIGPSVLVPIPLFPSRERARGTNQAREFARLLAGLHPGATVQEPLARVLDTPSQTRLNRFLRSRNVSHAFALRPSARLLSDRPHVLVDDVFTTGATLHAAASALRAGGIASLRVLTWAHG